MGSQVLSNLSAQPLIVYLIFSKYKKDIRSFNQELEGGGFRSFQCSRIRLRATSDAKAITLFSLAVKIEDSSGTPKIETSGLGITGLFNAVESVS